MFIVQDYRGRYLSKDSTGDNAVYTYDIQKASIFACREVADATANKLDNVVREVRI